MNTEAKQPSIITIPNQFMKGLSLLLMLSIIQGCSLFGGDDEDESLLPAELIDFIETVEVDSCLLYTSPSPRDATLSRMPSSA